MSTRRARHRRSDQSTVRASSATTEAERMLSRLATPPTESPGWVPDRPAPPSPRSSPADTSWAAVRFGLTRRALSGLALLLALAVAVAVLLVWQARPSAQAAPRVHRTPPSVAAAQQAGSSGAAAPAAATVAAAPGPGAAASEVVVHVVGAVRRPGLVRLAAGSRVADAVAAAGGLSASARAASVNLARPVVDGEQLVVQRRGRPPIAPAPGAGAAPPAGAVGAVGAAAAATPVDLNTATLAALDGLPGIGPVLAQRILDWRAAHGRFSTVDELGEVSGIGEATLGDLRPLVTV